MSNTIRKEDILNCLPLLASVLGKRYGVEVVIDGDTACTDGHTIYLPSLPLDSDESLLVQVRGFIDHESAHIRFTDFEAFQRNVENPATTMSSVRFSHCLGRTTVKVGPFSKWWCPL